MNKIGTLGENTPDVNMYYAEIRKMRGYLDVFALSEREAWQMILDADYDPYEIIKYG